MNFLSNFLMNKKKACLMIVNSFVKTGKIETAKLRKKQKIKRRILSNFSLNKTKKSKLPANIPALARFIINVCPALKFD